jgi:hypothetical protein
LLGVLALAVAACGSGPLPISLILESAEVSLDTKSAEPTVNGTFEVRIFADRGAPEGYSGRDFPLAEDEIGLSYSDNHINRRLFLDTFASPRPPYRIEPKGQVQVRFTVGGNADDLGRPAKKSEVEWMCVPPAKVGLLVFVGQQGERPEDAAHWGGLAGDVQLQGCPPLDADAGTGPRDVGPESSPQ